MVNRKSINIVLALLAAMVAFIILFDFVKNRPGRNLENPYEFDVSGFLRVDPSDMISNEYMTLQLPEGKYRGVAYHNNLIYVVADNRLMTVDGNGTITMEVGLEGSPTAVAVGKNIWIAFTDYVAKYDFSGNRIGSWEGYGSRSYITSMVAYNDYLYVADAGNRVIYQCGADGSLIRRIGDKDAATEFMGFVVPSPHMDVDITENGVLWASNPGRHGLVSFNADGTYRSSWSNASANIDGFCGCCNPSDFALLSDESFVTGEKTLLRVKLYDIHGGFKGVFASPDMFDRNGNPPDICVDDRDNIIILDMDRSQLRLFASVTM
jgi:hypothetical protein